MRISDWSSDVCSSDLQVLDRVPRVAPLARPRTGSAVRPILEGLAHGGLDLTEREALQEPQDLDVFALAGGAVVAGPLAGFQEAAQGGEGLGQVPLLERGGLVERADLVFEQREVVQRIEDKVLTLIGSLVAGDDLSSDEHTSELQSLM